jgi:UDP-glucose 4-epimerase
MKILLTGSKGFIGSHIYDNYTKSGHQVLTCDRIDLRPDIKDLQTIPYYQLVEKLKGVEVVNHHAADIDVRQSLKNPINSADNNIVATLKLLEACCEAQVKKFIFASSGGAIGDKETPESPYGITKLAIEKYLNYYRDQRGLNVVILRYSNVYGPRQTGGVISLFCKGLVQQAPLTINGGIQTRDFVYVKDVAQLNNYALQWKSGTYNVCSGVSTSINDVIEMIKQQGATYQLQLNKIISSELISGEVIFSEMTPIIPQEYQFTSLQQGIKNTIDFWVKLNNI